MTYHRLGDAELYNLLREERSVAEAAFTELYARHSSRVFAYCKCIIGEHEQTKDVYQETFIRFFESARVKKEMTNVSAYLLMIARNLCLNVKRNLKETIDLDAYEIPHIDTSQEHKELVQLIMTALELLPDDYREAFFLREFEDLPYAEIATIQQTNEGAVRVRVTRARKKIREILKPYVAELTQHGQ